MLASCKDTRKQAVFGKRSKIAVIRAARSCMVML